MVRHMSLLDLPRPLYFVLGGGGSLGAAHVGMLNAVKETGLRPDAVIGTSVGAVNGVVVAEDPDGAADRLLDIWDHIGRSDIFPGNAAEWLFQLGKSRTHFYSERGVHHTLNSHLNSRQMSDLTLPFATVATDFELAIPRIITEGSIDAAIEASAAIPAMFPMAEIDGSILCDGGVVANVPVIQAMELGARSMVVFDCVGPMSWGQSNIIEVMAGLGGVVQQRQRLRNMPVVAEQMPVLYLPPPVTLASPISFSHTTELIRNAYHRAVRYFNELDEDAVTNPGFYGEIPRLQKDEHPEL